MLPKVLLLDEVKGNEIQRCIGEAWPKLADSLVCIVDDYVGVFRVRLGLFYDVSDTSTQWCKAVCIKKRQVTEGETLCLFRYLGWSDKFDEWIDSGSSRIRVFREMTTDRDTGWHGCTAGQVVERSVELGLDREAILRIPEHSRKRTFAVMTALCTEHLLPNANRLGFNEPRHQVEDWYNCLCLDCHRKR